MHTTIEFLAGLGGLPNYNPVTGREAPFSNDKLRRAGSGRSIRLQSKRGSRPSGVDWPTQGTKRYSCDPAGNLESANVMVNLRSSPGESRQDGTSSEVIGPSARRNAAPHA